MTKRRLMMVFLDLFTKTAANKSYTMADIPMPTTAATHSLNDSNHRYKILNTLFSFFDDNTHKPHDIACASTQICN